MVCENFFFFFRDAKEANAEVRAYNRVDHVDDGDQQNGRWHLAGAAAVAAVVMMRGRTLARVGVQLRVM